MLQPQLITRPEVWRVARDGDASGLTLYERHYSAYRYRDGRRRSQFVGPGEHIVLLTPNVDALFVWRKFRSMDPHARGVNCAVFRNEGPTRSSDLILAAETHAAERWPGEPFYTYVRPDAVRSSNPGYCFICAGWRRTRRTAKGLHVLEKRP